MQTLKHNSKVLFNIFLNDRYVSDDVWVENIKKFEKLNIDWLSNDNGHDMGLSFQTTLNVSMIEAKEVAKQISTEFPNVIITLDEGLFDTYESFVKSGHYFDSLVKDKKYGIYTV